MLLLALVFLQASAQDNFQVQFISLIRDAEIGLVNYRGNFKKLSLSDSVLNSRIILEGTTNNEILVTGNKFHYMADVADSLNKKRGMKLADDLKGRVSQLLHSNYIISPLKIEIWNPAIYGWRFKHNGITISITLYKRDSSPNHFIKLAIDNIDAID